MKVIFLLRMMITFENIDRNHKGDFINIFRRDYL